MLPNKWCSKEDRLVELAGQILRGRSLTSSATRDKAKRRLFARLLTRLFFRLFIRLFLQHGSLSNRLEEDDTGGNRNIEAAHRTRHRQIDQIIALLACQPPHACA